MSAAWDVFVDALDPKTIRTTEAPPIGIVLRERPGGYRHQLMLGVHELNRARFLSRRKPQGDMDVLVREADGWRDRKYTFADWQIRVALEAGKNVGAEGQQVAA